VTDGAVTAPLDYPFPSPPEPGSACEVADGILWLRLPLPMRLDHVNAYALDDGDGWTIVDTGLDSPALREIWQRLRDGPLRGRALRRVLVTHHHPDHVGLAGWFQDQGAQLLMTRTAWLFARMLRLDEQPRPPAELVSFWNALGMEPSLLAERSAARPFNYCDLVAAMPLGFRRLSEGDLIEAGGRRWRVRLGQGHAPDHATLWSLDDPVVIAGDQVLPRISPNLGVYATEPEADPVGEWFDSCRHLAQGAREDQLVLPGHQRPFRGLTRRLAALAAEHEARLARLLAHLDKPMSAAACLPALYERAIGPGEQILALVEALAHLNHLARRGLVRRGEGADGVWLWQRARPDA
jgi:glyoxylase-like metal-dependent hydrolase (beta-lactamase superfamily II)